MLYHSDLFVPALPANKQKEAAAATSFLSVFDERPELLDQCHDLIMILSGKL